MANTTLLWSIERADRELRKQVTEGESIAAFAPSELRTAEGREHIWRDYNHTMLLSMFADDSVANEYSKEARLFKISYSSERIDWENCQTVRHKSENDPVADMRLQLSKQIRCLESILSRLPLFPSGAAPALPNAQDPYCAHDRIDQIRSLRSDAFDFAKLSRLCVELNVAWRGESYYAVAALSRAVLDHVPPVFGVESFEQVANNYNGAKSFKDSMKQLQQIKAIADRFLHGQIRKKEKLPARTQVDFRPSMDVLLEEIVRITPGA